MRERAKEWLEFADVDLRAAEKLRDDEPLARATAFHAHQCAEKSIKAILELRGERVPKIHNLRVLMESIRALGLNPQVDEDVLDEINQIYIEARYPSDIGLLPGGPPTEEVVERFITLATELYRFADRTVGETTEEAADESMPNEEQ